MILSITVVLILYADVC